MGCLRRRRGGRGRGDLEDGGGAAIEGGVHARKELADEAAAGLGAMGVLQARKAARPDAGPLAVIEPARQKTIGDVLDFDDIHIEFAPNLVAMVLAPVTGLDSRIANMRNHVATAFGFILPEIRLTDEASLPAGSYRIRLHGVERVADRLFPDRVLVLLSDGIPAPDGLDVKEPVYGAPARWIQLDQQEDAALSGLTVVSPTEVLATHLLEVLKSNLSTLKCRT